MSKIVPMITNSSNGYDGSLLNGLQSLPQWREYFNSPTGAVLGALGNGYTFGNALALPVIAFFNDKYGRLASLRVGCTIAIVGSALQAAAQNYAMFLVARIIIGFGSVIAIVGGPTLVSELAYPTHRGVATALFGPSWYTGAFISAWVRDLSQLQIRHELNSVRRSRMEHTLSRTLGHGVFRLCCRVLFRCCKCY